jgi:adenine-specific DNA methylase
MTDQDGTQVVAKALADIDRAFKAAAAVIDADRDLTRAFRLATELTEALRERTNDAANLRVLAVTRTAEAERLSLAGLAGRFGVSKARAAQIINSAKREKGQSADG